MSTPATDDRGLPKGYPLRPEYEIAPRDAATLGARGILVDVRTPEERSIASIDGSLHIPLGELAQRAGEIESAMRDAGLDPERDPVAVYCHHGARSLKAALFLLEQGLAGARSIAGGIDRWSIAVDTAVPRYERTMTGYRRA